MDLRTPEAIAVFSLVTKSASPNLARQRRTGACGVSAAVVGPACAAVALAAVVDVAADVAVVAVVVVQVLLWILVRPLAPQLMPKSWPVQLAQTLRELSRDYSALGVAMVSVVVAVVVVVMKSVVFVIDHCWLHDLVHDLFQLCFSNLLSYHESFLKLGVCVDLKKILLFGDSGVWQSMDRFVLHLYLHSQAPSSFEFFSKLRSSHL